MGWRDTAADVLEVGIALLGVLTQRQVVGGYYDPFQPVTYHPIYKDRNLTTEQRRADRDAMLPDEWTAEVWNACRKWWKNKCAVCGSKEELQRDHIIPVASIRSPGAVPSNLLPLCRSCNSDKSAQDLATWYSAKHGNPDVLINKVWDWQDSCFERGWR